MRQWSMVFLFFLVLGLLLFYNSFNNKFLMDDYVSLSNPVWSSSKFILSQWNPYSHGDLDLLDNHIMTRDYRPLTYMVLNFCYSTFRDNLWQYHLFNLVLFAFAASLVYLLVETILGSYKLAFLTGLMYLIHPVNGHLVNYISSCLTIRFFLMKKKPLSCTRISAIFLPKTSPLITAL